MEAKIANGIEEPITLQIPEKYLGLDKEDVFDETKKQVRIIVDPKTLHPFQKSVRPPNDRSFKLYREDLKRRVDITITGIFFGQKSQQLMNKLVQQFIDLPDKITQLIPEENGLHRLEGDTPMPSSDIYVELENQKIKSTVVCEPEPSSHGIQTCFSFLASTKYDLVEIVLQKKEMPRWTKIKGGTEQLLACFEKS